MTLRRSDICVWLLAGSLLAAAPVLAQKKTNKPLTPEQQAERAKFDPKADTSPFGGSVISFICEGGVNCGDSIFTVNSSGCGIRRRASTNSASYPKALRSPGPQVVKRALGSS